MFYFKMDIEWNHRRKKLNILSNRNKTKLTAFFLFLCHSFEFFFPMKNQLILYLLKFSLNFCTHSFYFLFWVFQMGFGMTVLFLVRIRTKTANFLLNIAVDLWKYSLSLIFLTYVNKSINVKEINESEKLIQISRQDRSCGNGCQTYSEINKYVLLCK